MVVNYTENPAGAMWASGHVVPSCNVDGQQLCEMSFQVSGLSRSVLRLCDTDECSDSLTATGLRTSIRQPNSPLEQIRMEQSLNA